MGGHHGLARSLDASSLKCLVIAILMLVTLQPSSQLSCNAWVSWAPTSTVPFAGHTGQDTFAVYNARAFKPSCFASETQSCAISNVLQPVEPTQPTDTAAGSLSYYVPDIARVHQVPGPRQHSGFDASEQAPAVLLLSLITALLILLGRVLVKVACARLVCYKAVGVSRSGSSQQSAHCWCPAGQKKNTLNNSNKSSTASRCSNSGKKKKEELARSSNAQQHRNMSSFPTGKAAALSFTSLAAVQRIFSAAWAVLAIFHPQKVAKKASGVLVPAVKTAQSPQKQQFANGTAATDKKQKKSKKANGQTSNKATSAVHSTQTPSIATQPTRAQASSKLVAYTVKLWRTAIQRSLASVWAAATYICSCKTSCVKKFGCVAQSLVSVSQQVCWTAARQATCIAVPWYTAIKKLSYVVQFLVSIPQQVCWTVASQATRIAVSWYTAIKLGLNCVWTAVACAFFFKVLFNRAGVVASGTNATGPSSATRGTAEGAAGTQCLSKSQKKRNKKAASHASCTAPTAVGKKSVHNSKRAETLRRHGDIKLNAGRLSEAFQDYQQSSRLDPCPLIFFKKAHVLKLMGRMAEAEQATQKAKDLASGSCTVNSSKATREPTAMEKPAPAANNNGHSNKVSKMEKPAAPVNNSKSSSVLSTGKKLSTAANKGKPTSKVPQLEEHGAAVNSSRPTSKSGAVEKPGMAVTNGKLTNETSPAPVSGSNAILSPAPPTSRILAPTCSSDDETPSLSRKSSESSGLPESVPDTLSTITSDSSDEDVSPPQPNAWRARARSVVASLKNVFNIVLGFCRRNGPVGIRNLGNTCFIGSLVQVFSQVPGFVAWCHDPEAQLKPQAILARLVRELVTQMHSKDLRVVEPVAVVKTLIQHNDHWLGVDDQGNIELQQQDAMECMDFVVDNLHEGSSRVIGKVPYKQLSGKGTVLEQAAEAEDDCRKRNDSPIEDLFGGTSMSTLVCHKCRCPRHQFERTTRIDVPLPEGINNRTVSTSDCLQAFCEGEVLNTTCDHCGFYGPHDKSFKIWRSPEVLCLGLKRGVGSKKIKDPVKVERSLTLSAFFNPEGLELQEQAKEGVTYELIGIVHHRGSLKEGHYWAQCRNAANGRWYKCDDSLVTLNSIEAVAKECAASETAYMLVYQRQ